MTSAAETAETDPSEARSFAPPPESLSGTAARGFAWMTAQTLLAKVVTLVGQVVLAWLLVPESFGLIGMAYTVMGFASVIQQGGLRQVLVNRQKRFHLWANPGFWLGLSLGVFAALVMVAAGPLVAIVDQADSFVRSGPGLTQLLVLEKVT